MATRISELPNLVELTAEDLLLAIDLSEDMRGTSKKITFQNLISSIDNYGAVNFNSLQGTIVVLEEHLEALITAVRSELSARIQKEEEMNLQAGLSCGFLYVQNLEVGGQS